MQRIRLINESSIHSDGAVVVTQTSGMMTDKVVTAVAATLEPGQEVVLSVWDGSRLSMVEKPKAASVSHPDNSTDLKEPPTAA